MRINILDWAEQDLLDGREFYEQREPGLGEYFLDSISADIDSLAFFGGTHRKVGRYYRALAHTFPFALYYTIQESQIDLWAVLDCRRNPAWITKQLKKRV